MSPFIVNLLKIRKVFLEKISVLNYKNIQDKTLEFSPTINCLVGENGVGKTNFLDAIYHLSVSKSYFSSQSVQNVRANCDFYLLDGVFKKQEKTENIVCSFKKNQKKTIKKNGKPYTKISEHIGQFPVVIVSPYDRDLITEASQARRRFLDSVISQLCQKYLSHLISYNNILSQRNALLKHFFETQSFDPNMLNIYSEQLGYFGDKIFEKRKEFLQEFTQIFKNQYEIISGGKEQVEISYQSPLFSASFETLLQTSQEKDKNALYTTQGIHKDDLLFLIEGNPVKKFASQGQQKSFLTALRLAEFLMIKQKKHISPILLLDDIFDKLDEKRVSQLLRLVSEGFGQVFLSDTHSERTQQIVQTIFKDYKIFEFSYSI